MKKVNFYKVYSRLGMQNLPWQGSEMNYGVEDAPDYILTPEFLAKFDDYLIKEFKFSLPENIKKEDYFKTMARESLELASLIEKTQKKRPATAILIGGDHSVSFGSIIAEMRLHRPENVGVIHFDSHDDVCNVASSPTKNFHGMFLRALTDPDFDNEDIRKVSPHLPPKNVLIIGNLDCSVDAEGKYLADQKIKYFELKDINADKKYFENYLAEFLRRFKHIHISFDIDVFDKSLVSATGTPTDNGFFWKDIDDIFNIILTVKILSVDLVEINPKKDKKEKTYRTGLEILTRIIHKR